jgi:CRISPR/Cas system CMR-associated protein Cmr5 small subunit
MFNIFKSKTQRTIEIVDKLKDLQQELDLRKRQLNTLYSNTFNHYDKICVFAEKEYSKVNGYTERLTIRGSFAQKIIEKLLEDEVEKLKIKISKVEDSL